jgi:hypothetical protein
MTDTDSTLEGVIHLHIDLRVDAREMRHWPPQCIARFFEGIALTQGAVSHAREAMRQAAVRQAETRHQRIDPQIVGHPLAVTP